MLELMLGGPKGSVSFKSGPGNKVLLAGNLTDGWFGLVPRIELPGVADISRASGAPVGNGVASTVPLQWLKAVINGKYIFVPNASLGSPQPFALYNAGIFYGVKGPGSAKFLGSVDTEQFTVISFTDTIGVKWYYKMRLLELVTSTTVTAQTQAESEAYKLYSHVLGTLTPADGKRWDSLVINTHLTNDVAFGMPIQSNGGQNLYTRSPSSTSGQWASYANPQPYIPVLELLDPEKDLIPVTEVIGLAPPVTGINATSTVSTGQLITPSVPITANYLEKPVTALPSIAPQGFLTSSIATQSDYVEKPVYTITNG